MYVNYPNQPAGRWRRGRVPHWERAGPGWTAWVLHQDANPGTHVACSSRTGRRRFPKRPTFTRRNDLIGTMSLAGEWYTSGTFWAAGTVLATLAVGIATVIVTYMVGFPKRRLQYGMPVAAPMLTAPDGVRSDLELLHRGVPLTEPHVVELTLASRGRKDIPSDAYDGGTPIRIDVGARIIELLRTTSSPTELVRPRVAIDGTALEIGPSLLGRRQGVSFTVLVEGRPSLSFSAALIDVDTKENSDSLAQPLVLRVGRLALAAAAVVVAVAAAMPGTWMPARWMAPM